MDTKLAGKSHTADEQPGDCKIAQILIYLLKTVQAASH